MNKSVKKSSVICHNPFLRGIFAFVTIGSLLTPTLTNLVKAEMEDSPKLVIDEVWQLVNNDFVDRNFNGVNWLKKREELLSKDYHSTKEAYRAINKSLQELNDPYTRFLPPEMFESLTTQTSGEISGLGIRLAVDKRNQDIIIVDTLRKSPAQEAGLKRGDRLVKIDGKPTALMSLEDASKILEGELGTTVNLQVVREGMPTFEVTITRAQIEIPSVTYNLKEEGNLRVGYIKLDEFSSHASEQMKVAINDLQSKNASAFVLDLRGNPGGLLFASVDIARMLMQKGEIVDIVDRTGGHLSFSADGSALTDLPLVVLVDGHSASASEILAGALKENSRAILVGTTTYGKGLVQSVHALSDGSGLAVTISRYYLPRGISINKKGIKPDVLQELTTESQNLLQNNPDLIGTNADSQYSKAIAVLKSMDASLFIPKPSQPLTRN